MLRAGDKAPLDAVVWTTPRETASIGNLIGPAASPADQAAGARPEHPASGGGRPILLLFYLFDWSTT
jgi:hypothetical protein